MKIYTRKGSELNKELLTEESTIITFKVGEHEQNTLTIYEKNGKLIINTDSYSDMLLNMTASNSFEVLFKDSI